MTPEMDDPGSVKDQLRRVIEAVDAAGRSIMPGSGDDLLQSIVTAAAQIFGAAAASIALIEEGTGEMVFRVAYGAGQDEIIGMRFPINQGISGYVAMTGQPIAISNVLEDPRFNKDFAASTGYVPDSMLVTPLLLEDRVIGVMSVLDKINASSFGMQDMELLGVFAQQAAIAINQSQKVDLLGQAVLKELRELAANTPGDFSELNALLDQVEEDELDAAAEVQLLVSLYRDMGGWGENERIACLKTLTAFAEYVRTKPRY